MIERHNEVLEIDTGLSVQRNMPNRFITTHEESVTRAESYIQTLEHLLMYQYEHTHPVVAVFFLDYRSRD